jgi:quercetin dioxygenase-like cupin family protein
MKKFRIKDLPEVFSGHIFESLVPGRYLSGGALSFKAPGFRTHDHDGPGGADRHVHGDCEVFVILQGKAVMEVDDQRCELSPGDVIIVEPGEDHHLVSDVGDPCVNLWLHADGSRHPDQEA